MDSRLTLRVTALEYIVLWSWELRLGVAVLLLNWAVLVTLCHKDRLCMYCDGIMMDSNQKRHGVISRLCLGL